MPIKGKQLQDYTILQSKLNITTDSIVGPSDVTNSEFVQTRITENINNLNYSTLNLDMTANAATIGELACDTPILEFPISDIQVKINGLPINVGETKDCYFSPDAGSTIRVGGAAEKGDDLYWNHSEYSLDTSDEIDFVYLTAKTVVDLAENTTLTLDPYYPALNIRYTGAGATTSTVIIDGLSFIVANIAGEFVWDYTGPNETTLATETDLVIQNVNGLDYTIWFDGFGSLLFSIKKGNFSV